MIARVFGPVPVGSRRPVAVAWAAALLIAGLAACDKVPLSAPTESTIELFATGSSVPLNGSVDIVATVTEAAGTPVQNGTVVLFTTTLGRIDPAEARTSNGRVTVKLVADGRSGTATVTAISGAAEKGELELAVGAAAADNIVLRAEPASVGANGGTVQLVATVRDENGNPIAGVPVTFSTTAGQVSPSSVTTDANGDARASLTTTREAEVTARAGAQEANVTVSVQAAPEVSVTVAPTSPFVNQPAVFTITVTPVDGSPVQSVTIDFGDGERLTLGPGSTSVSHIYSETGTYTVSVRVRDTSGQETSQTLVIAVVPVPTPTPTPPADPGEPE